MLQKSNESDGQISAIAFRAASTDQQRRLFGPKAVRHSNRHGLVGFVKAKDTLALLAGEVAMLEQSLPGGPCITWIAAEGHRE